jgi:lysophospholipase L1-like esterase
VVAALVVLACLCVDEDEASASHRAPHPQAPDVVQLGVEQPIEDPTGHALDSFHGALRRAERGAGQARVIWWGASHTAPDLYVGNLRRSLQLRFGDAGPGFVSPVRPFPAYDTSTARIAWGGAWRTLRGDRGQDGYYGFGGFAVESLTAGSWGSLDTHGGRWGERPVGQYDVAFLRQPNGGRFEVRIDDRAAAVVDTHGELGDGHAHFRVVDGPHRIEVRAIDDAPVQIFGIAMERDTPGVVIDTMGIPGSRARGHLRWDDTTYRAEIRRRHPDLVVLAYGTNESEDANVPLRRYESDLTRVVHRIRQTVPGASCLLVGPTDRPLHAADGTWQPRPLTTGVIDVQRRVAVAEGCGFFDMQAFMGGPMSMMDWVAHTPPFAQPDHVHLTAAGHARLAEVMERALLERY